MPVKYSLGTGLREPCDPYRSFPVFGVELNQVQSSISFNCAPEVVNPSYTFDLSTLQPNHEVCVALAVFTEEPGGKRVTINWYRDRDSRKLFTFNYDIPPAGSGQTWSWYGVYSYIGYVPAEIWENGRYHAGISIGGGSEAAIFFEVVGVAAAAAPATGKIQLPDVVRSTLDSSWVNIAAGDWGSIGPIKIPPFSFEPGRWALKGLDVIIDGLNWAIDFANSVEDKASSAFSVAGNALTKIDNWLSVVSNWLSSQLEAWWSSTWGFVATAISTAARAIWDFALQIDRDVVSLGGKVAGLSDSITSLPSTILGNLASSPLIRTLIDGYNKTSSFFALYLTRVEEFFLNPVEWIFDRIANWLNEEVPE